MKVLVRGGWKRFCIAHVKQECIWDISFHHLFVQFLWCQQSKVQHRDPFVHRLCACLSIRLSRFAYAGATCVTWNTSFTFKNVTFVFGIFWFIQLCEVCHLCTRSYILRLWSRKFCKINNLIISHTCIIGTSYRFSGIREEDMEGVITSLRDVQAVLLSLFTDKTILIGHSLESDLCAVKVSIQGDNVSEGRSSRTSQSLHR